MGAQFNKKTQMISTASLKKISMPATCLLWSGSVKVACYPSDQAKMCARISRGGLIHVYSASDTPTLNKQRPFHLVRVTSQGIVKTIAVVQPLLLSERIIKRQSENFLFVMRKKVSLPLKGGLMIE